MKWAGLEETLLFYALSLIIYIHWIANWAGLEETFKAHLIQPPPCIQQEYLQLDQVAQSSRQLDLEWFQEEGISHLSEQPRPVPHHWKWRVGKIFRGMETHSHDFHMSKESDSLFRHRITGYRHSTCSSWKFKLIFLIWVCFTSGNAFSLTCLLRYPVCFLHFFLRRQKIS